MNLNSLVSLGQEEAKSLACLLECPCLVFELLSEETLVNADLSPTKSRGNFLSDHSLAFLRWGFMNLETNPDFIFLVVAEMVRCSDAEFMAF